LFNVGRLTAQKNHEALVKALVDLPDCTAVVAGEGPLRGQLVEMARKLGVTDRFRLLGEITSAEVERWMRASAVFVFPSRYEAMPMALLEAMRAGMAIVASDIPAHREVAGGAVLLSSTSPLLLATTIQSALRQRNNGNPLGLLAKERSAQFTAEAMTDGYLELL
jgi:glycosyltransferase involved in cell wall biosynthesis